MKVNLWLGGSVAAAAMMAATPALATPALTGGCAVSGAIPLKVGTLQPLGADKAGQFSMDLAAGEGVLVELSAVSVSPANAEANGDGAEEAGEEDALQTLRVCDASGLLLSPLPSDVFGSGGSLTRSAESLQLRFVAPAPGRYLIAASPVAMDREILLRRRQLPQVQSTITELELGGSDFDRVSSARPLVYSFAGRAGQWVRISANSDNDTLLELAAPASDGSYSVIARNDDSDGLNPVIRQRLPATGQYYFQVAALGEEASGVTVLVQPSTPPPPPPPPAALRPGVPVEGSLAGNDDRKIFALPVMAGRTYRLAVTARYDAVVEVGVEDPLLPDGTEEKTGFTSLRARDAGLTGTEVLNFTARTSGRVLVLVRGYNVENTSGAFRLTATDEGQ